MEEKKKSAGFELRKISRLVFIISAIVVIMSGTCSSRWHGCPPLSLTPAQAGADETASPQKEINNKLLQARVRYDNSKYEEAIGLWNEVLALDPQNKEALQYVKKAQDKLNAAARQPKKEKPAPPPKKETIIPKKETITPKKEKIVPPKKEKPVPPPQPKKEKPKERPKEIPKERPKGPPPAPKEAPPKEKPGIPPESKQGKPADEILRYLAEARTLYDDLKYDDAIEVWNRVLTLDPQNKEASGYLEKMRNRVENEEMLKLGADRKVFPEKEQREIDGDLKKAGEAYDASRYEKAIELYKKVLAIDPENKKAQDYLRRAQDEQGREKKPTIMQKKARGHIDLGRKYYNQRMFKWAASEWKKAQLIDPTNAEVAEDIKKAEARIENPEEKKKPIEKELVIKKEQGDEESKIEKEYKPVKPVKEALSLEDALQIGIKNHMPVRIAWDQVKLSRLKEQESYRELFPAASIRWEERSGAVGGPSGSSQPYAGRTYQLKVQHPLYHGGELRYTWEQAKVNLRIARENYEKTKEDFSIELAKSYFDLAKAIKNSSVQDALLKDLENDLSLAKKELDQAATTLVEFLNVQSQYNQAYYASLSSENTLSLAKSNFKQLLNLEGDPTVNVTVDTNLVFKDRNIDLEKCIELAYDNRSDLKISELGIKSADYGQKVAKSQSLPRVDLTGTYGKSGEAFTPGQIVMSDDWFVGAKVNIPWGPNNMNYQLTKENLAPSLTVYQPTQNTIHSLKMNFLDNLASYTDAKQSEITAEQAYSDLLKSKHAAATEVREAYFNYQEAVLKLKNSTANRELYQKELVIIKEKRSMNDAQTQDVVAAKVKLATEETNYTAALVDALLALEKLNKAIGIKSYFN